MSCIKTAEEPSSEYRNQTSMEWRSETDREAVQLILGRDGQGREIGEYFDRPSGQTQSHPFCDQTCCTV
jgi:hypothetical protein